MESSWESASADVTGDCSAPHVGDDHFTEVATPVKAWRSTFGYRSEPRLNGRGYFVDTATSLRLTRRATPGSIRIFPFSGFWWNRSTTLSCWLIPANQAACGCVGGNNSPRILRRAVGKTGL